MCKWPEVKDEPWGGLGSLLLAGAWGVLRADTGRSTGAGSWKVMNARLKTLE